MNLSRSEKSRLKTRFGEWAIVTGASSGIGLELATHLAEAGFNLVINARNRQKLEEIKVTLSGKYSIEVKTVAADLSTTDGIHELIQRSIGLNIGLLINNAGYGTSGLFGDRLLADETNMLMVNCKAVLSLTHHFVQDFKQRRRGGIVFLSSLVAFQGVPYAAHYAATKAYVQTFAEALAVELEPYGTSVLVAAPGPVESNFGQRANLRMGNALTPSQVAVPILQALGRETHVIPGLLSKVLTYSLRTVPRVGKIRIMQLVMGGFTKHQRM